MSIDPLTAGLNVIDSLIDRVWTDPDTASKEKIRLAELAATGNSEKLNKEVELLVGQLEINKQEAASSNWFVAGWRPFVGWVCGFGLAYVSILEPIMRFIASMAGYDGGFPVIDTYITMQVLLGMIGLGVMRTREKEKGVNRK